MNEGASAAWQLAGDHPELFSAVLLASAPEMPRTAKFDPPQNLDQAKNLPLWAMSTVLDGLKPHFNGNEKWKLTEIAKGDLTAQDVIHSLEEQGFLRLVDEAEEGLMIERRVKPPGISERSQSHKGAKNREGI